MNPCLTVALGITVLALLSLFRTLLWWLVGIAWVVYGIVTFHSL